jgi:2-dehydropantoate 2-reductase
MKIVVLGAGALGCALGSVLIDGGNEVWLVNRDKAHVDAINQLGLRVQENGVDRFVKTFAVTTCSDVDLASGPIDLVIVLVKSFHTREAIESAKAILGKDTLVLSLQNGLGHEDILSKIVGTSRLLAGKTYAGGVIIGPGHIIAGTKGKETYIGELNGQISKRVSLIAKVFNDAGLLTHVSENITGTIWDKLLVNIATGALSGITRLTYGELYQLPEVEACAIAAVAEAMAVAKSHGITLSVVDPKQPWVKAAAGLPYEFKASMLQSLEKGSVTEVDFVNGAVVRWGAQRGIPTPVNQALVACIKGIERDLFHVQMNKVIA